MTSRITESIVRKLPTLLVLISALLIGSCCDDFPTIEIGGSVSTARERLGKPTESWSTSELHELPLVLPDNLQEIQAASQPYQAYLWERKCFPKGKSIIVIADSTGKILYVDERRPL